MCVNFVRIIKENPTAATVAASTGPILNLRRHRRSIPPPNINATPAQRRASRTRPGSQRNTRHSAHGTPHQQPPFFPPTHRVASLSECAHSCVALPPLVVPTPAPATVILGSLCRSLAYASLRLGPAPAAAPGSLRACRAQPRALSRSPRSARAVRALRFQQPCVSDLFRVDYRRSARSIRSLRSAPRAAPRHSLGSGDLICVHYSPSRASLGSTDPRLHASHQLNPTHPRRPR